MSDRKSESEISLRTHRLTVAEHLDIVADVGGPESGQPVILLHGGGQTRHSWKNLAQTLVRSGHRVTNADLRGHGESGWAADGDYSVDAFVSDLRVLISHQPSPPVLIGASMGGVTSLLAAGESQHAIASGIALVDIVPKIELQGSKAIFDFMNANPNGFATLEEAAATVAAYLPDRPRPPSSAGLMKNLRQDKNDGRLYWHWDPNLVKGLFRPNEVMARMDDAARKIRVPTLLVRGAKSDIVSLEGVRHFLELIPDATYVDIKDASHMVAGDMNDVFSQAIIDFIEHRISG